MVIHCWYLQRLHRLPSLVRCRKAITVPYSSRYAHYDGNPSFSDTWAYSFGGWTSPAIKQYNDQGAPCISADLNWCVAVPTLRTHTAQVPRLRDRDAQQDALQSSASG